MTHPNKYKLFELKPVEKGLLYAVITLLIWSSFHLVSRIGGTSTLTVFDIAALRIAISALALSPWWLPRLLDKSKRKVPFYQVLTLSLLTGIGYPLMAYTGYVFAPASHGAVIIVGLLPPFTAAFTYLLMKEKPSAMRVACIVLVVAGVTAMLGSAVAQTGLDLSILKGDAIF
ncbi:MAG: DMT family transporter, partial [Limnobacter sp.]|nr:DMT family transporter [Limnobacter sp.]